MTGPLNPKDYRLQEAARLRRENRELQEELTGLRKFVESMTAMYDAADKIRYDSQLYPFLRRTLEQAMKILNAPDGSLALLDDETNEMVFVLVVGDLEGKLTDHRMAVNEGIAGWVVRNAKPALVQNCRTDPRFYQGIDDVYAFNTHSMIAAPLIGDRKVYGVIEILNRQGDESYSESDLALLKLMCRGVGEVLADIDRLPQPDEA